MNKKELKAKLDELKIPYEEDATNAELEALIPEESEEEKAEREKKEKEEEEKKLAEEEAKKKKEKKVEITKAHIYLSPRGNSDSEKLVRTYTEEQSDAKGVKNGQDFIEKAEGYAKKIGGTVRTE